MKNWYHKLHSGDVTKSSHQKSPKSPVGGILQSIKNKTCRGSNSVWKIGITSFIRVTLLKVATKNSQNRQNRQVAEFWNGQFWEKWCQIVFNDVPYNFCSEKNRKCFCKCRFPCQPPFCRTVKENQNVILIEKFGIFSYFGLT